MLYLNRRPEIRKFPLKSRKKSDKRAGYRYHYLISDQMIKNMHFTPSSVFCVPISKNCHCAGTMAIFTFGTYIISLLT